MSLLYYKTRIKESPPDKGDIVYLIIQTHRFFLFASVKIVSTALATFRESFLRVWNFDFLYSFSKILITSFSPPGFRWYFSRDGEASKVPILSRNKFFRTLML